ncbi:MAG: phosphonopyruvate decarboxylase [Rhodospirillaceae bacterium]|jgi:phosphonopyruvate decarboxylase|nr:phosphonopyruvate decarboxylase [Rhodospirillaceae bacterium]MBT6117711.1 phosphonopyruvate decarboxylase [Rhodospirillaceae bacterium]
MIAADDFLGAARRRGLGFYTGVPCSFLTPLINRVISDSDTRYVGATSEGEAVAIAAGAWLAGEGSVVMCQNSGLGNMINPLTSLNWPFRIPTLMIVTWRGQPGLKDEPQHELMGQATARFLDDARVPHGAFPDRAEAVESALDIALDRMAETHLPYAFIMAKGAVADEALDEAPRLLAGPGELVDLTGGDARPKRFEALERLLAGIPDAAAVIATTGFCGRELFTLADRPQHLYQVGSMGGASAMALGVALNTERPVVVLDGDGAALMKLGNMATVGAQRPGNLVHVLLDNGMHESTGGQATVSSGVDFAAIAVACGYRTAMRADSLGGFEVGLARCLSSAGPSLLHVRLGPGAMPNLGRPTVTPVEVAQRFKAFVTDPGAAAA